MKETLKFYTKLALEDKITPKLEWNFKYPAQLVLSIRMIKWTKGTELAFAGIKENQIALTEFQESCIFDLQELVELVRSQLKNSERISIGAYITLQIHCNDIIM